MVGFLSNSTARDCDVTESVITILTTYRLIRSQAALYGPRSAVCLKVAYGVGCRSSGFRVFFEGSGFEVFGVGLDCNSQLGGSGVGGGIYHDAKR